MEYAIVCNSQSSLRAACIEHGLDHNDVYVICSVRDLSFALKDTEGSELTLFLAHDWRETNVKELDIRQYVGIGENCE